MSKREAKKRRKRAKEKPRHVGKLVIKRFEEKMFQAGLWIMFIASASIVIVSIIALMWFFLTEANFSEILKI